MNLRSFTNRSQNGSSQVLWHFHVFPRTSVYVCSPAPKAFRDEQPSDRAEFFSCLVTLSHGRPGRGQPGDGALKLGLPDPDLAQAGVIHGGRRGDRQRGGQARVGGAPQELGGQASGYGARG